MTGASIFRQARSTEPPYGDRRNRTPPNGRVTARLTRFIPPGPDELHPVRSEVSADDKATEHVAGTRHRRGFVRQGRARPGPARALRAEPAGPDWRINKLALRIRQVASTPMAGGASRATTRRPSSTLTVVTDDAGQFLDRFGFPVAVRNAPTTHRRQAAVGRRPQRFRLSDACRATSRSPPAQGSSPRSIRASASCSACSRCRRCPGGSRSTSATCSARASPSTTSPAIFAFAKGMMHTDNLKLAGPAAHGAPCAATSTSRRRRRSSTVRVTPALSTMVSAGAAVLFLANPIVGAAVGAGTLLAQKFLDNPIDQIFSYEYRVTGSWSDPHVERVRGAPRVRRADRADAEHAREVQPRATALLACPSAAPAPRRRRRRAAAPRCRRAPRPSARASGAPCPSAPAPCWAT